MLFCRLLIFFNVTFFSKNSFGNNISVKTVWIQIGPNVLSGLILVQTICKGYQQMTLVGKELLSYFEGILKNFTRVMVIV